MTERRETRTVEAGALDDAARWADATLTSWGLTSPLRTAWMPWARQFAGAGTFELAYEYDPEHSLLTCDLVREGRRVFGLDDFVPPPSPPAVTGDLQPALTWQ